MHVRVPVSIAVAVAVLAATGVASAGTYTVRRGDTLGAIAKRTGTGIAELVRANGLADPDRIREGQVLVVPDAAASMTPDTGAVPAGRIVVVRRGESLSQVAKRAGTTVEALARANGIVERDRVPAGVGLRLTAVAGASDLPLPALAGGVHVVTRGESLARIARRYGTTVAALARSNGIADPDLVREGQRLTVAPARWRCPVEGRPRFTNDWGYPRARGRWHEGTDLFAPAGTPVLAPVAGTVTTRTGPVGGLQVTLAGDDDVTYIATHLARFGATGRVAAGATIGHVGTSGNAAGGAPHLHFEVHPRGGAAINPYPTLRAACA